MRTEESRNIPVLAEGLEDDDWEDEDDSDGSCDLPRFLPRAPSTDGAGNPFLTVVHSNGFHSLPVVWCNCAKNDRHRDVQLLDLQLYPASYTNIRTVFTFSCLDNHRYDNLECKSSHYQYHSKLRRLTCPDYPDASPNRIAELRRVTRQWRNLKYRKWFWMMQESDAQRGAAVFFCPACPQPGINLPPNWKQEYAANP